MRAAASLGLCMVLLWGCREQEERASPIDAANPIEMAAREANLVEDPNSSPPTGLFERRHTSGRDAICIVPAGLGGYRFGLIASFGTELKCQGHGELTQDGDRLNLEFDGVECEVEGVYDGRSIRISGAVPSKCSEICGPRASISGVSVSRVGWTEEEAMTLLSRNEADKGLPLCRR